MIPLTFISKRITGLLFQTYSSPVREMLSGKQRDNLTCELPGKVCASVWIPLEFIQKGDYWRTFMSAPEITRFVLNHADVLIYCWKENSKARVSHYRDKDFGESLLWTDHCVLLEKILLTSNYDASGLYQYIIIPEGAKDGFSLLPPDHKNYQAVCQYCSVP